MEPQNIEKFNFKPIEPRDNLLLSKHRWQPWEKYNKDKSERLPSLEELKQRIRDALDLYRYDDNYIDCLATCALASTLYITGSRITEITKPVSRRKSRRYNPDGTLKKVYEYNYLPEALKLKDIYLSEGEPQYIRIRIKIRKSRGEVLFRECPIRYEETNMYYFFVSVLEQYIEIAGLKQETDGERILFEVSTPMARRKLAKYLNYSPHTFRNLRASHLAQYNKFSAIELQRFFEWKNAAMPLRYSRINIDDMEAKL